MHPKEIYSYRTVQ